MVQELAAERLRAYLRALPDATRATLALELSRGAAAGEDAATAAFVLRQLSQADSGGPARRTDDAPELFYACVEPFVVADHVAEVVLPGRIARTALASLWRWLMRDLLPGEAECYAARLSEAEGDEAAIAHAVRSFRNDAARALEVLCGKFAADDSLLRKVAGQIGGPQAAADVPTLAAILAHADALTEFSRRLPRRIAAFHDGQLDTVRAMLMTFAAGHPGGLTHALVLVQSRLAAPWQLIRLSGRRADEHGGAAVRRASASLAMAGLRREAYDLKIAIRQGRVTDAIARLKEIHNAVRGIRTEMSLDDPAWSRDLAALRAAVSGLLKAEIADIPGHVRRLLRPRLARPGSEALLDPDEVAAAESRIALLGACRNYASELALNQVASAAYVELQAQLEIATAGLLDAVRAAGNGDRAMLQSRVDAAVRFCGKLFGADYAALLGRAAATAAGERRTLAKA